MRIISNERSRVTENCSDTGTDRIFSLFYVNFMASHGPISDGGPNNGMLPNVVQMFKSLLGFTTSL